MLVLKKIIAQDILARQKDDFIKIRDQYYEKI